MGGREGGGGWEREKVDGKREKVDGRRWVET